MYDGWLTVAGIEIVNRARTIAYKDALLPTLEMRECGECFDLTAALGDSPYTDPVTDEAPWYDPDTPGSGEFIGFVAASLIGFEDSTREATVTESNLDGGTVGKTRRATREMRVAGVLIGTSQVGTSAGLSWLKAALDGNLCNACDDSDDICFFTACPRAGESPDDFIRHLRRVKCTAGPTVISEAKLSCGGYMVQVEFTLVAGSPYVYGEPVMVAAATGSTLTPILAGSEVFSLTEPIQNCIIPFNKRPTVIKDPDCPPVPNAPTVPSLSSICKPIDFSAFDYPPNNTKWLVKSGNYNSRPVVARKPGSPDVVVAAYAFHSSNVGYNINASSIIKAKTSADGITWGSEYTLYDEGSGTRGLSPSGLTWAGAIGKFIMGVSNINFSAAVGTFARFRGEILTSTTGASGSWSVLTNLDSVMSKFGMKWYYLTDVKHFDDGSADGVTYAAVHGVYKAETLTRAILLRSLDGAATWQVVNGSTGSSLRSFQFPQIAIWQDGSIGMTMYIPEQKAINFRYSDDGGASFGPTIVVATAAEGLPAPVVTNDGTIFVMHSDVRRRTSRNLGTHFYRYSRDRGQTWRVGENFADDTIHGYIGAGWTIMSNGDILAVYGLDYSNTDARIQALKFQQIERFLSYAIGVPDSALRAWADGVMLLQIRTGAKPTRQMRVRLIPRPFDDSEPGDLDPCSVCSGFIIDYAPANTLVYLDGMTQRVTMSVGNGVPSPADHLVSGESGNIFEWPLFTCGTGYFVIIDVDVNTIVDVALAVANRE